MRDAFFVGFAPWKDYLQRWFPDMQCTQISRYLPKALFYLLWAAKIRRANDPCVYVWGFKYPAYLAQFCQTNGVPIHYVEDGFVRSVALGASKSPPASLTLDTRTMHYDPSKPSDLEHILETYDFDGDPALMDRARESLALILDRRVSKYNAGSNRSALDLYGEKAGKRILVVGQVEDDASIRYGCAIMGMTNNDVVRLARRENPQAEIIYKPHPEVLQGTRKGNSDPRDVADICRVLTENIAPATALETIDHVYTITSLMGFEAVLRGLTVTTVGCPFYSGWGQTDDRQPSGRRGRQLSVTQLFAASYLLYCRYFDPDTGEPAAMEDVVKSLGERLSK